MMNQAQDGDESLMAQVAQGKREPLERLIRRYANPLLTFIRRMVGDAHKSEELFQEVFLAVWLKRGQYTFPRPFKAWLYAIALNKCRVVFRTQMVFAAMSLAEDSPTSPPARGASPVDSAIATETASLVATAVDQLPPQQRAVVVLRIWDGLSYAEIAETFGRTERVTVRTDILKSCSPLATFPPWPANGRVTGNAYEAGQEGVEIAPHRGLAILRE